MADTPVPGIALVDPVNPDSLLGVTAGGLVKRMSVDKVTKLVAYADVTGRPTLGTLAAISAPGGTSTFLRGDGTFSTPAGGGSALWSSTAFSGSVALSAALFMPSQSVSSVIAFTPNGTGAAAGASNYVRLIADGTNAPTFTGFTEHGSSAGYDNRNNYPNYITFWFDGTTYWYSIQQAAVPIPIGDTVPPALSTAVIGSGTPTVITLTYSESLTTTPVPATTAFTVGGTLGTAKTVSSISITGAVVSLTCSSAFISTDTPTITYAVPGTNPVRDLAGNAAAALTAQAVTNNVTAGATILRFATLASMAESGNGTTGWIYTASAVFTTSQASGPSKTLASAADGSYSGTSPTTGATTQSLMGLKTVATAGDYTTYNYGIYANGPSVYRTITAGAGGGIPNGTALAPANGDIVRMRRTGTSIFAEVSKDSGATFTILNTWTGASTAQLWPIISTDTGLAFGPFTSIGMT